MSAILWLTKAWTAEYEAFRRRDLTDRDYVYLWADGVHFTIRLEEERLCTLIVIGVRPGAPCCGPAHQCGAAGTSYITEGAGHGMNTSKTIKGLLGSIFVISLLAVRRARRSQARVWR